MSKKDARARRDLDETRRLAYMVLASRLTGKYELVATLTNALAHHQGHGSPEQVMAHLVAVAEHGDPQSIAWLKKRISRITAELGG